jgi:hypothetical protein
MHRIYLAIKVHSAHISAGIYGAVDDLAIGAANAAVFAVACARAADAVIDTGYSLARILGAGYVEYGNKHTRCEQNTDFYLFDGLHAKIHLLPITGNPLFSYQRYAKDRKTRG